MTAPKSNDRTLLIVIAAAAVVIAVAVVVIAALVYQGRPSEADVNAAAVAREERQIRIEAEALTDNLIAEADRKAAAEEQ